MISLKVSIHIDADTLQVVDLASPFGKISVQCKNKVLGITASVIYLKDGVLLISADKMTSRFDFSP